MTGKLSKEELADIRDSVRPDLGPCDGTRLLDHIAVVEAERDAAQASDVRAQLTIGFWKGKCERVEAELREARAALDMAHALCGELHELFVRQTGDYNAERLHEAYRNVIDASGRLGAALDRMGF